MFYRNVAGAKTQDLYNKMMMTIAVRASNLIRD
jgi:hypothetical protein